MPCVTDRFYASNWVFDYTDDAPSNGKWLNGHDGSRMVLSRDSSETAPAGYTETWVTPNVVHTSETGTTAAKAATHWNYDTAGDCADLGAGDAILPLTNSISALNARIDGLSAYGATAGTLGTAFSWYLLSPNFGNVWPTGSTPQAYSLLTQTNATGGKKLRKIAILMTDGAYNTYRNWKDSDLTDMSNAAKQMCTSMKAKGIEVYTVGFALGELPLSEKMIATNTLQNCGSDVSHFYNSLNTTELANAFSVIGAQVGTGKVVRITK